MCVRTDNNVDSVVKFVHVLSDRGASNTGMALGAHVVTQGHNHLLDLLGQLPSGGQNKSLAAVQLGVNLLQNGNGEGGSLASSRLGLSNGILVRHKRRYSLLLDGTRDLKPIAVYATKQSFIKSQIFKFHGSLWFCACSFGHFEVRKIIIKIS